MFSHVGSFVWKIWAKICLEAPLCAIWYLQLFDLAMGEPRIPHFYDVGLSGRVHEPQNQLSLSVETPGYFKMPRKPQNSFEQYDVGNCQHFGNPCF